MSSSHSVSPQQAYAMNTYVGKHTLRIDLKKHQVHALWVGWEYFAMQQPYSSQWGPQSGPVVL